MFDEILLMMVGPLVLAGLKIATGVSISQGVVWKNVHIVQVQNIDKTTRAQKLNATPAIYTPRNNLPFLNAPVMLRKWNLNGSMPSAWFRSSRTTVMIHGHMREKCSWTLGHAYTHDQCHIEAFLWTQSETEITFTFSSTSSRNTRLIREPCPKETLKEVFTELTKDVFRNLTSTWFLMIWNCWIPLPWKNPYWLGRRQAHLWGLSTIG